MFTRLLHVRRRGKAHVRELRSEITVVAVVDDKRVLEYEYGVEFVGVRRRRRVLKPPTYREIRKPVRKNKEKITHPKPFQAGVTSRSLFSLQIWPGHCTNSCRQRVPPVRCPQ